MKKRPALIVAIWLLLVSTLAAAPLPRIGATEDALLNRTLSRDDDLGILGGDMLTALGAIIDYENDTLYLRSARSKK